MNLLTDRAKEVFLDALDLATPDGRTAFLDRACGGDGALRAEVEGLLAHHPEVGSFLKSGPRVPDAAVGLEDLGADRPGSVIGRYRLMEQIGEGGFGLVYVAEQTHPVRRKLALKVLKPGMDTREVVARFEAERQALALMDHPNIATVLDAGATPAGRPYFVMELVRGVPITRFCDDHKVPTRDRLGLFADLCAAVQHAHTKGIIHRDIKPSNVLVTSHDGTPVVKVIDFGVAKAVGPSLTDKTVYTRFTQMVGTPLYMSPEQAGSSGLDVDTRTDIYALGVLLYELLTGTTPFDQRRLQTAGYDELRRIIREEEPARPSTRLSTLGSAATPASANRGTDARRLTALIRGELDWIVMRALEKDRTRRYETASAFAADVRRFLADEPVQACPPSAGYRARKFVRRNKRLLLATGLVLLTLVAGISGTTSALIEARSQRRQSQAHFQKARHAVDEYFTLVSEDTLLEDPAQERLREKLLRAALRYYEGFVQDHGGDPELRAELAAAHLRIANITYVLGTEEDWLPPFQKGVALLQALVREKPDVSTLHSLQGGIYRPVGAMVTVRQPAEALRAFEQARALWEELVREHPTIDGFRSDLAAWHSTIGFLYSLEDQPEVAARSYQSACDLREELVAKNPDVPRYPAALVISLHELSKQRTKLGQQPQAEAASRRALGLAKRLVQEFPDIPSYQELLGQVFNKLGQGYGHASRVGDMEEARRETLASCEKLVRAFPLVARYRTQQFIAQWRVGNLLWDTGRRAEAEKAYRRGAGLGESLSLEVPEYQDLLALFLATCWDPQFRDAGRAVELAERAVGRSPQHGISWNTLGVAHYRAGAWGAAIAALEKSRALRNGGDCRDWFFLAMAHWKLGNKAEARTWYDRAVEWMEKYKPRDEELRHSRTEAAELLGIEKKKD